MAYTLNLGFDPASMTKKNLGIDTIVPTAYAVISDEPELAVETNLSSPMGRPETFEFGRRLVKDIYAANSIELAYRSPAKAGIKVLINWASTASLTNSADPTFRQDFPVSVRTTVTVPASDYITGEDVLALLQHQIGGIFATGTDVTSARLTKLLRGALPMEA